MADFVSQSEFDFSVRVSTHAMTVRAGQPISVPVMVGGIKGKSRPIKLTTSDWRSAGLSAEVVPSEVPSGRVASLNINIPLGTPPGSYLFTVRGSAEGTFKTSNDTITVTVEPETEERDGEDRQDAGQGDAGQGVPEEPTGFAAPAKRASLFRSAKKSPARPVPKGQRAVLLVVMFVMIAVLAYYVGTLLMDGIGGSVSTGSATMAGTYTGTSTFCINSVMGGAPECSTSTDPSIQIDGSGNVLGPGLFGKISGTSFTGEARAGDGTTFPMTGTFSNGTLSAEYKSSSVTWTITVHR